MVDAYLNKLIGLDDQGICKGLRPCVPRSQNICH